MKYIGLLCAALLFVSLYLPSASASDSTQVLPAVWHDLPAAGSTFTYSIKFYDGEDTTVFDTVTVLARDITFHGKAHVSHLRARWYDPTVASRDICLNYDVNGDIEQYCDDTTCNKRGWRLRLPLGSKGKTNALVLDSIYISGTRVTVTLSFTYLGEDTLHLLGRDFVTSKIHVEAQKRASPSGEIRVDHFEWWSHDLGLVLQRQGHPFNEPNSSFTQVLTSYTLK